MGNRIDVVNGYFSEEYGYDGTNQITSFDRNDGDRTMEWDYDALGNWTGVEVDNVNQARTHNQQNQITGISGAVTPTYDANGNMTGDETGRVFAYDAWNRLVSVSDDEENVLKVYEYDGLGRRVRELPTGEDAVDLYYSAGWQVLEEHVDEEWYANYVWSPVYVDALILRDWDDERLYSLHDVQFNVVALVDDGGDVVERYVYDAFGAVTVLSPTYTVIGASTVGWVIGFQGMRYDEVSGLSHQRARWYSATLGRWVTTDPILFAAGDNNFYRMVGNGPTGRLDPSGLSWLSDGWDWVVDAGGVILTPARELARLPTHAGLEIFRGKLPFAAELLEHSLRDNPSDLVYSDGSMPSNKVKLSAEYKLKSKDIKDRIAKLPTGPFSGKSTIEFNSDTDLFAAIHAARLEYHGSKSANGCYSYTVKIIDTYNFESQIIKAKYYKSSYYGGYGYYGNSGYAGSGYYGSGGYGTVTGYKSGVKGAFFTIVNELALVEELLTAIRPYRVTVIVNESGCCP